MRNYKNVVEWQRSDDLAFEIYRATRNFPKEEIYGLTSQIRRAAVSVPSNIAEGAGRESNADYFRFLSIARGSLAETEYFLHLAKRLEYLLDNEYEKLKELTNRTFAALHGLMQTIDL
jgi:four helix bundle protein